MRKILSLFCFLSLTTLAQAQGVVKKRVFYTEIYDIEEVYLNLLLRLPSEGEIQAAQALGKKEGKKNFLNREDLKNLEGMLKETKEYSNPALNEFKVAQSIWKEFVDLVNYFPNEEEVEVLKNKIFIESKVNAKTMKLDSAIYWATDKILKERLSQSSSDMRNASRLDEEKPWYMVRPTMMGKELEFYSKNDKAPIYFRSKFVKMAQMGKDAPHSYRRQLLRAEFFSSLESLRFMASDVVGGDHAQLIKFFLKPLQKSKDFKGYVQLPAGVFEQVEALASKYELGNLYKSGDFSNFIKTGLFLEEMKSIILNHELKTSHKFDVEFEAPAYSKYDLEKFRSIFYSSSEIQDSKLIPMVATLKQMILDLYLEVLKSEFALKRLSDNEQDDYLSLLKIKRDRLQKALEEELNKQK